MDKSIPHIVVLSEQAVRAKSLSNLVRSATGGKNSVQTMEPGKLKAFKSNPKKPIFLLDLMGCHQPSQQIIKSLKNEQKGAKIIVLHMYQSKSLIAPLLNEGVDGYLYYEPSRTELAEALKKVQNGKKHKPEYADE